MKLTANRVHIQDFICHRKGKSHCTEHLCFGDLKKSDIRAEIDDPCAVHVGPTNALFNCKTFSHIALETISIIQTSRSSLFTGFFGLGQSGREIRIISVNPGSYSCNSIQKVARAFSSISKTFSAIHALFAAPDSGRSKIPCSSFASSPVAGLLLRARSSPLLL